MKKTRLNLQIPTHVRIMLDELTVASGATSITEVIRRSLAYYEVLISHTKNGGEVIFRHKDGTDEKVRFL